jgi:hypothetical protein
LHAQVYGQSYQAKDLRAVVQKYNMDKDNAPPSPPPNNKRKLEEEEEVRSPPPRFCLTP